MHIAVLPTKYTNMAVAIGPPDGTWKISGDLPEDLLIQLKAQISHRLALYCWEIAPWAGIWPIALLWAVWGGLALGISSLWDYGLRTALLYGWVRILFFGNGIMLLTQCVYHWRGLKRARLIRNHLLNDDWEMDAMYIPSLQIDATVSEQEYIETAMEQFPHLKPWYERLLEVQPPKIFDYYPLGATGFLRRMLLGPRIPMPTLAFDMGALEC